MLKFKYCHRHPKVEYAPNPKFGTIFTPHMLHMKISADNSTELAAEIVPFADEFFSPGALVLHYGQSIFEGMKAYRQANGGVAIFRPDLHAKRFVKSAERMAMPALSEKVFLDCLREYVAFEQENVPNEPEHSLYLRPLMIARDTMVKVGRSKTYTFYILGCIAGSYFPGGAMKGCKVLVNRQFVRAFPGGLGEAKTAANYAASLWPQSIAEKHGCDQVLYLDGIKHDYIDELGGMNFFMVRGGQLVTPVLNGAILNGVTRRSILDIASQLKLVAREEKISFTELKEGIQAGTITEAFACGTAAVVSPIGEILYQDQLTDEPKSLKLSKEFPVGAQIGDLLKSIQRGVTPAPGDWLLRV
ncbi:MAG: branched-chain amino acid aminotransferase [Bdellovibrionia bacterium]